MAKVQKIAYSCSTRERKNACVSLYIPLATIREYFHNRSTGLR